MQNTIIIAPISRKLFPLNKRLLWSFIVICDDAIVLQK